MSPIRQSNFELLRILCALFIIAGHVINVHGSGDFDSSSWYISVMLSPWFSCAVNTFILLSGYFGIRTNMKKMWLMNDMVTFYSIVLFLIAFILGVGGAIEHCDIRSLLLISFPVISNQYWFITGYFALYFLAPVLNHFVDNANRKIMRYSLIVVIGLFVFFPTIAYCFNFKDLTNDAGHGIVNFCLLYLLGRFIYKYDLFQGFSRNMSLLIYLVPSFGCGLCQVIISKLLGFSFTSFFCYNTIFIFMASIGLFLFFQKIETRFSRFINWASSFCLSSYVIHAHPIMFKYLFVEIFGITTLTGIHYIASIFCLPIVVYVFCAIIESLRRCVIQRNMEKVISKIPYFADKE